MRSPPGDYFPETPEDYESEDIWNYDSDIYVDYEHEDILDFYDHQTTQADVEYHHQTTGPWRSETPEDHESEDLWWMSDYEGEPYEYEHAYGS